MDHSPTQSEPSSKDKHSKSRRRWLLGGLGVAALGAAGTGGFLNRTPLRLVEGRSRARSVQGNTKLPTSVDVVVIGGGYVGTTAALTLAERGISVALCEKGVVAGEASGRSMGYVDSAMQDAVKYELIARSKVLWSELNARVQADTGFRPTGVVDALDSPEEEAGAEAWLASIKGRPGADGRILTGKEITALFPDFISPPASAIHIPSDASVEPRLAAPVIAETAQRKGASILQQCAVRGLQMQAGAVSGVVTEKGPIACRAVVLAGGAWSALFARSLGLDLPQLDAYMSLFELSAVNGPKMPFSTNAYGFRPQIDGNYSLGVINLVVPIEPASISNFSRLRPAIKELWPMVHPGFSPSDFWHDMWTGSRWSLEQPSPFEERRILMPQVNAAPLEQGLVEMRRHFPVFEGAQVRERWAGVLSSTPDNMPVISAVSEYPGLYVGTAFINGLTMGLAAGEALADLAMGRKPIIDLHDYRLSRFQDGTPITFRS